jgi:hypothetical protein
MPSYDEDRSSVHTELEAAGKAANIVTEEKYHELEANRHPDMDDPNVKRGLDLGLSGSVAIIDPSAREDPDAVEDPNATGAVVSPRQSETGEWEVNEDAFGGEGMEPVAPADVTVPPAPEEPKARASKKADA